MSEKTMTVSVRSWKWMIWALGGWILGCIIFPMISLWHYAASLFLAVAAGAAGWKFNPLKTTEVAIPLSAEEKTFQEKLNQGNGEIQKLKDAGKDIISAAMKERITEICSIASQMMEEFQKKPQLESHIRRVTEFYLPMLTKLIMNYHEFENHAVSSENIKESQKEIEETLTLSAQAFHQLWDDMQELKTMEINAETEVLETLLANQGLIDPQRKDKVYEAEQ